MDFSMNIGSFSNTTSVKRQSPEEMLKNYMEENNCSEAEAMQALQSMYGAPQAQQGVDGSLQSTSIFDIAGTSSSDSSNFYSGFNENYGMPQMDEGGDNFFSKIMNFFSPNKAEGQEGPQKPGDYDPTQEGVADQNGPQKPGDYDPTQEGVADEIGPQKPGDYDPTQEGVADEIGPQKPGDYDPTQEGVNSEDSLEKTSTDDPKGEYINKLEEAGFSEEAINALKNDNDDSLIQQEAMEKGIKVPER